MPRLDHSKIISKGLRVGTRKLKTGEIYYAQITLKGEKYATVRPIIDSKGDNINYENGSKKSRDIAKKYAFEMQHQIKKRRITSYKMEHLFSLTNKTALITGGAGHLGLAMAKGLADFGANVTITGRSKLNKSFGKNINYVLCDVTNRKEFQKAVSELDTIDILINNAFNEDRKKPEEITEMDWVHAMNNMLNHVFYCSQAVIPRMLSQGSGSIINISSIYGFLGIDQRVFSEVPSPSVFYSAAKGGVLQLTKRLATEYGSKGIRVNTISPGAFPKKKVGQPGRPGYINNLSSKSPMQRVGQPEEIAGAAVYLASNASSFVTGHNLVVDGGWSAW
jgi:gluconate 5-dehydrogenase